MSTQSKNEPLEVGGITSSSERRNPFLDDDDDEETMKITDEILSFSMIYQCIDLYLLIILNKLSLSKNFDSDSLFIFPEFFLLVIDDFNYPLSKIILKHLRWNCKVLQVILHVYANFHLKLRRHRSSVDELCLLWMSFCWAIW